MEPKKLAFFLPNTFTALNMACGFGSILLAFKGDILFACHLLLLGSIFDSVDGRVARLTGTQSEFGEQFDSISDVISFGIAPAIIMFNQFLAPYGKLGAVVCFVYLLCGALRLARFNTNLKKIKSDYFQGLPIPGAALIMIGFCLFAIEYPELKMWRWLAIPYTLIFSVLMISNFPFYSFKNSEWVKKRKKLLLFVLFIILALVFVYEQLMIGVVMWIYIVISVVHFFLHKGELSDIFEWTEEHEE